MTLWEGNQEVVKRSGRDESGISLCSYLYLKLAKTLCLSYYLLCFLSNKLGMPGSSGQGGGPNNVYTCKKCKNDKIKKKYLGNLNLWNKT
jgi:hypothetical protein